MVQFSEETKVSYRLEFSTRPVRETDHSGFFTSQERVSKVIDVSRVAIH